MRRRRLLALAGVSLPAALSGCLEGDTGEESGESDDTGSSDGGTEDPDNDGGENQSEDDTEDDDSSGNNSGELAPNWPSGPYEDYETTIVEIETVDGETLGQVRAALAETSEEWRVGLSEAESMPENGGMLFVSDSSSNLNFWMINMDFGLDIVYVGADKRITSIHHAPAPEEGDDGTEEEYQFAGEGQYVLEVNKEWTTERGVSEGDRLSFEL